MVVSRAALRPGIAGSILVALLAAGLLLQAGCRAERREYQSPQVDYDLGKYLGSIPQEFPEQREYRASDGSRVAFTGYRRGGRDREAIIYLHSLEGHAEWGGDLAIRLSERGHDVFALDRRGSGRSRDNNRTITGQPPGFEDLVSDVHSFVKPLKGYYRAVYLLGHDWGARLALAYAIAYKGQSDGLILLAPRLRDTVDAGLTDRMKAMVGLGAESDMNAPMVFDPQQQVSDAEQQRELAKDPQRRQELDENFVTQSERMADFVAKYIQRVDQPVQVFLAPDDSVVDGDRALELIERGQQPSLDVQRIPGARHALPIEAPERIARDVDHWIRYQESLRRSR